MGDPHQLRFRCHSDGGSCLTRTGNAKGPAFLRLIETKTAALAWEPLFAEVNYNHSSSREMLPEAGAVWNVAAALAM